MTTIRQNSTCATLINVFTVQPETAKPLAELLRAATEDVMCHLNGFRTANIHVSTDGTRVVNYAQWETAQAYEDMLANPAAREHMAKAAGMAISFDPHLYTVGSVHTASS